MSALTTANTTELRTHIAGSIAKAIAERPGETEEQQLERFQTAIQMIMALAPTDAIETILAGHCIMFHEMLVHSFAEIFRAGTDAPLLASFSRLGVLDRCFGENLRRLERRQNGTPEREKAKSTEAERKRTDRTDAAPTSAATPPESSAPSRATPAQATGDHGRPAGVEGERETQSAPDDDEKYPVRPEMLAFIASCVPTRGKVEETMKNEAAVAAMRSGDAAGFARALGVEPTPDFLAAAARPGSPFNPVPA
jgi:hypothetical protein